LETAGLGSVQGDGRQPDRRMDQELNTYKLKNHKHSVLNQKNDELKDTRRLSAASSNARESRIEQLSKLEKEHTGKISEVEGRLDSMLNLESQAVYHINGLERGSPSTFISSYQGDDIASEEATRYLMGVFPEWRRPPAWFKALTENFQRGRG